MRKGPLVISVMLSLWLIALAIKFGLFHNPLNLALVASLAVLIIGSGIIYRYSPKGESAPLLLTYISYGILLLMGYSVATYNAPQPSIASEFLLASSFLPVLAGVWNVIKELKTIELLPQIAYLMALLLGLWGLDIRIVTGIASLSVALVISRKSLGGLILTSIFSLIPIVGLANTATDLGRVPHIVTGFVSITSLGYSYAVLIYYISWIIGFLIGGVIALLGSIHFKEPRTPAKILEHSIASTIPALVYIFTVIIFSYSLLSDKQIISYHNMLSLILGIALPISAVGVKDLHFLIAEKARLRSNIAEIHRNVKTKIKELRKAISLLQSAGIRTAKLIESQARIEELEEYVKELMEDFRSGKKSYGSLKAIERKCRIVSNTLDDIENVILSEYRSAVEILRKASPYIKMHSGNEFIDVKELALLSNIGSASELPLRIEILKRISRESCNALFEALKAWLREVRNFLGIDFTVDENVCRDTESPLTQVSELLNVSSRILQSVRIRVSESYRRLTDLKAFLKELLKEEDFIQVEESFALKQLRNMVEVSKDIPESMPPIHLATKLINEKTRVFAEEYLKVFEKAYMDLSRVRAELASYEIKGITNIVSLVDDLERRLNVLSDEIGSFRAYIENKKPSYEVLMHLSRIAPDTLKRVFTLVNNAFLIKLRASIIPMVFDFLDWKLEVSNGRAPIDELPFTKDALLWFLRLYVTYRKDVTVKGGMLYRK